MPISVSCPSCQATYRVPDEAAGKAVKCKKCGGRIVVPAAGAAEPAAAAGGGDDFDFSKPAKSSTRAGKAAGAADEADAGTDAGGAAKKKSSTGKILAIVGGILALSCCVCGGAAGFGGWWVYGRANAIKDAIIVHPNDKIIIKDVGRDMPQKGIAAGGPTILEKKETLTAKDPAFQGKPAKTYKVNLEAGKKYVIDLKADNKLGGGDPYLLLLDAKGKELAHDDDSGGFPDAQIRFTPPAGGEYTIQATTYNALPPTGMAFTLTVKVE